MEVDREIPMLRVRGGHRSVGQQIGEACADAIRRATAFVDAVPRGGRSIEQLLEEAEHYRQITGESFPFLLEELDGVADGAGVDARLVFAASIEELWDESPGTGCTDVLVTGEATASGHLLVAHNNDLSPGTEDDAVAIEWDLPGAPLMFSLGVGPWISVGWNSAGVSLTGNELSPNDERRGIPRLLLVRAQLRARSVAEAAEVGLHPARASAYNTVLADRSGACVNVEASATDHVSTGPNEHHAIIHTNHYVSEQMASYEGDPDYAVHSGRRLDRATELIAALPGASIDEPALRAILSDHANAPDAVCRHATDADGVQTVFWCIADVTAGRVTYGRGNPCDSTAQHYVFEPAG